MAKTVSGARPFIFVLHSHQPVGNFEHVFEECFVKSYKPMIDVLEQHPGVKAGLHYTGSLFEWIAREHGDYLDQLARLVDRGQVEILGGGFYEPILSTLPDSDAAGQIEMMAMFCQKYFGRRPEGMWLAERVWDPDLPRVLAPCGIKYTLLDDTHFRAAGIGGEVIGGHYLTEKAGHAMAIFPIDKGLRYRIPFSDAAEVIDYLKTAPAEGCLTYGDDGEKFGVWPNTYEWVFEKKWLTTFFGALEKAQAKNEVRSVLPVEYLAERPPVGRVYLPNASYDEMMEWALPVRGMKDLHDLREKLKKSGEIEKYGPYLRGAIWQNFLAKYSEANQIHKKMLYVSERLQTAMEDEMVKTGGETIEGDAGDLLGTAQRELYKGQCCCAYWHGLFGGLYLNYLRDALYRSLLSSERILDQLQQGKGDWISYEEEDIDLDGRNEVLVSNRLINVYIRAHAGASVFEIDYKPKAFNLTNMLMRREEGYHGQILTPAEAADPELAAAEDDDEDEVESQPKTIHDIVRVKEEGLEKVLTYDDVPRACFVDRFLPPNATLEMIKSMAGKDLGDFAAGEYSVESIAVDESGDASFHMHAWRSGSVAGNAVTVEKRFRVEVDSGDLKVSYGVRNDGDETIDVDFATELNFNLLAGSEPSRYVKVGGSETRHLLASEGTDEQTGEVILVDEWQKIRLEIDTSVPAKLFRYPVETVSQSENGLERTFQGTCLVPSWSMKLAPGEKREINVRVGVVDIGS
jgi:alpha-amylase